MEPCGTPQVIGAVKDQGSQTTLEQVLLDRDALISSSLFLSTEGSLADKDEDLFCPS